MGAALKLYEIVAETRRALDLVVETDGELTDEQAAQLDSLDQACEAKVESTACYVHELEAEAEAVKTERDRLAARAKTLESRADWLRGYLLSCMLAQGRAKVQGRLVTVAIRVSPPALHVLAEDAIPRNYFIQPPPVLDRKQVLDALKAGAIVPGAEITRGEYVRIR